MSSPVRAIMPQINSAVKTAAEDIKSCFTPALHPFNFDLPVGPYRGDQIRFRILVVDDTVKAEVFCEIQSFIYKSKTRYLNDEEKVVLGRELESAVKSVYLSQFVQV